MVWYERKTLLAGWWSSQQNRVIGDLQDVSFAYSCAYLVDASQLVKIRSSDGHIDHVCVVDWKPTLSIVQRNYIITGIGLVDK